MLASVVIIIAHCTHRGPHVNFTVCFMLSEPTDIYHIRHTTQLQCEGSTHSVCLSVSLTDTPTQHWRQQAPPSPQLNSNYVMRKKAVPLKSSLNQTQLIPLFSLIVLCKERVFPIRLLTPAVALSDLLGCRNEIIDCTITQLVIRDSAVLNEHSNCVVEVNQGLPSYLHLSQQG